MSNAFNGCTQNVSMYNVQQIGEKESLHRELRGLEEKKKSLAERINAHALQGTQDEDAMAEHDQVEKDIEGLKAYMKKYGLEGGRRKKHRRTHRRSKSRAKKSGAKKSRRSKH
jgi:hypothetical protein